MPTHYAGTARGAENVPDQPTKVALSCYVRPDLLPKGYESMLIKGLKKGAKSGILASIHP
jgi:hypothetical protein